MHFGAPSAAESRLREDRFVQWLAQIAPQAKALYIVGDLFDFWFEWKHVVPRGYVRLLGALAALADSGTELHLFPGNHDLWYRDYFVKEIGAIYHPEPLQTSLFGHLFYIAHGDGLGPGDHGYKFIKHIFTHRFNQWVFARLHPNFATALAQFFSRLSSNYTRENDAHYYGEQEFLYQHASAVLEKSPDIQHFVFGHRHIARQVALPGGATMHYLGDWIRLFSWLEVTEAGVELRRGG